MTDGMTQTRRDVEEFDQAVEYVICNALKGNFIAAVPAIRRDAVSKLNRAIEIITQYDYSTKTIKGQDHAPDTHK